MFFLLFVISCIGGYVFLVFGIAPFVVPHMRKIIYQDLPDDLEQVVIDIVNSSTDNKQIIERIFYKITSQFSAARNLQFTHPSKLFLTSVVDVWEQGGVQSCTVLNFVLANALYATGKFTKSQIRIRTTYIGINIHQYVEISFDNTSLRLDPWGYYYGVPVGSCAYGILPWRIGGIKY